MNYVTKTVGALLSILQSATIQMFPQLRKENASNG